MRITHRFLISFVLLPLVALTVVSTILLWPSHRKYEGSSQIGANAVLVNATAVSVVNGPCPNDPSGNVCENAQIRVTSGPDKGQLVTLTLQQGPGQPVIHHSDKLVLGRAAGAPGQPATYYFDDFQRKIPLLGLSLIFAGLVVLIARWRGIGALIGLVFTWFVVTNFLLPAVLAGSSPVLVSLTAGAAIVIVVLYVAHGFNPRTTIALIGTLLSLGLTGLMAWGAVKVAHLTGLASDEATYVQTFAGQVNLQGLLLGGIIIGSLGVLNDMTVTQASSVWEIHIAQPLRSRKELYSSAIRVGRDHIASSVYTLVLAYTGAALPLLVLFAIANRRFGDVVGSDVVAEEIVRALVGSIGLILSVPLTTALAALAIKNAGESGPAEIDTRGDFSSDEASGGEVHQPEPDESAVDPSATIATDAIDIEAITNGDAEMSGEAVAVVVKTEEGEKQEIEISDLETPIVIVPPKAKKRLLRRRTTTFDRKMSRRERKFWEDD